MSWEVHVLGANSAVPTIHRYPSGQVLNVGIESILIDCGEGSQLRMLEYGIKNSRINTILISHLHGDHIYGLPGLLTSYNLFNRKNPLWIFGPEGVRSYVTHMMGCTNQDFSYPLHIQELTHSGKRMIYEKNNWQVHAFPLNHRIPTYGYKISELITRTYLSREKIVSLGLSEIQVQKILAGESVIHQGVPYGLSDLERFPVPLSYAYISDTAYFPECAELTGPTRLIYHESTFLESELTQAIERFHSTAKQAALTALHAPADHLLLGHYSSRYTDIASFRSEAETVFSPVSLARSGKRFIIPQEGDVLEEFNPLYEKN